jgi:hypothetical protein
MREYTTNRWCPTCDDYTLQECRDSEHERDSSQDYQKCLTCGSEYSGYTGEWTAPEQRSETCRPNN